MPRTTFVSVPRASRAANRRSISGIFDPRRKEYPRPRGELTIHRHDESRASAHAHAHVVSASFVRQTERRVAIRKRHLLWIVPADLRATGRNSLPVESQEKSVFR